jgi:glycosyltransferase involved in cell wall biosynthesis
VEAWKNSMNSTLHDTVADAPPTPIIKPAPQHSRRLRVCMVAYAFYESDTRILQYATALAQRGDSVDVIALRRDKSLSAFEVFHGVNVFRIQCRTVNEKGFFAYANRIARFFLRSTWRLYRNQRDHPYDVVHVHNVPDFLVFTALSAKWKKKTVILDIHDLLPEFFASKFKINHDSFLFKVLTFIEKCSAAFATHVIIANDIWKNRLVGRSSHASKCSVVRNRPDLSIFQAESTQKKRSDKFILTYPGSLNWHQGLDIAIRAFASVAGRMPDAEFHIYGEGPAKSTLVELAGQLGMQDRILFHDFLSSRAIAKIMAATDLAIEPKRANSAFSNEALSTKILEFMSLGVPVIACRTKIHAYYYDDSIIQYYEDDNEKELAEQMLRLKNDPALRARLAANAEIYVRNNTWDARKHEYLELIDSLVQPKVRTNVN